MAHSILHLTLGSGTIRVLEHTIGQSLICCWTIGFCCGGRYTSDGKRSQIYFMLKFEYVTRGSYSFGSPF